MSVVVAAGPESVRTGTPSAPQGQRSIATARLFGELVDADEPGTRDRLQEEVVLVNMALARSIARRYTGRGVPMEDLDQIAYLALVRAVGRFDPEAGHDFLSFAVPTIRGDVRRYFRDHGWMVRPPRRIQELQPQINRARSELTFSLGRSPRPVEIAMHLEVGLEQVIEALVEDSSFAPASLDSPDSLTGHSLGEALVAGDAWSNGGDAAEARAMLLPALSRLSARDRRIVHLRFIEQRSQTEIGQVVGVSQMQVSRLLTRILRDLRASIGALSAR